jgi:hypothetical protein
MFLLWGKKAVYRPLGYAADFCPFCREPRCFSVRRVGMASHVCYLTSGKGQLAGYQRICQECGTILYARPTVYAKIAEIPLAG